MEMMMFMHDYINNRLPPSFHNMYSLRSDVDGAYATRQSNMFILPRTKSRFVDRLPLYQFPALWNKNVSNLEIDVSRNRFKRQVKSGFLDTYLANVNCDNPRCVDCQSS